jgi:hypothetical protein
MLATGDELATAASQALGVEMKFENISECVFPQTHSLRQLFVPPLTLTPRSHPFPSHPSPSPPPPQVNHLAYPQPLP